MGAHTHTWTQKIWLQGNGAVMSIPRKLCFWMHVAPGDLLECTFHETTNELIIKPWGEKRIGLSPGYQFTSPPELKR